MRSTHWSKLLKKCLKNHSTITAKVRSTLKYIFGQFWPFLEYQRRFLPIQNGNFAAIMAHLEGIVAHLGRNLLPTFAPASPIFAPTSLEFATICRHVPEEEIPQERPWYSQPWSNLDFRPLWICQFLIVFESLWVQIPHTTESKLQVTQLIIQTMFPIVFIWLSLLRHNLKDLRRVLRTMSTQAFAQQWLQKCYQRPPEAYAT